MKKFEEAIVTELLHILFLLRVGSIVALLALPWLISWPWNLVVMAPFIGGPVLALGIELVHCFGAGEPSPGEEAERRRVRARMELYRQEYVASLSDTPSRFAG